MVSFSNHGMSREQHAWSKFDDVFGKAGLSHEETYYDPMHKVNKLAAIGEELIKSGAVMLQKGPSLDSASGGSYTAQGLIPAFVDPQIVDRSVRETPLVKLLPRKAVRSLKYVYNVISAKAGAKFLPEDSSLTDQVDTRSTSTVDMKFLYAVGRVTSPAQVGAQSYINLMAEDIRVKTESMNEALENEILNGAVATNANGFDGLITQITTTNSNNAGAAITLDLIRQDMNSAFYTGSANGTGLIDLVVMDGYTHNFVKGLLMDFQRNVERPSPEMSFGIPDAFMFDGALFIRDRFLANTAGARRIIYLDSRYVFLAVLQDYVYKELAKVNDSDKFYLSWYGALVVNFEAACAQRYNLA